jgi:hypothetical protein
MGIPHPPFLYSQFERMEYFMGFLNLEFDNILKLDIGLYANFYCSKLCY